MTIIKTHIDWDKCLKKSVNNHDAAESILALFISDLTDAFPKILNAWEAEDYNTLRHYAHKMHGGSCYTGVPEITELFYSLEQALTSPKTTEIAAILKKLSEAEKGLIEEFEQKAYLTHSL